MWLCKGVYHIYIHIDLEDNIYLHSRGWIVSDGAYGRTQHLAIMVSYIYDQ